MSLMCTVCRPLELSQVRRTHIRNFLGLADPAPGQIALEFEQRLILDLAHPLTGRGPARSLRVSRVSGRGHAGRNGLPAPRAHASDQAWRSSRSSKASTSWAMPSLSRGMRPSSSHRLSPSVCHRRRASMRCIQRTRRLRHGQQVGHIVRRPAPASAAMSSTRMPSGRCAKRAASFSSRRRARAAPAAPRAPR